MKREPRSRGSKQRTVPEVQHNLRELCTELRRIEGRLAELYDPQLSPSSPDYEALMELEGKIDCVRNDLLDDAIATLEVATALSPAQLRLNFLFRPEWPSGERA